MIKYVSEIMLIIVDYLVHPKDFFNLRLADTRMRKCLPAQFGTTLEVLLRAANLMRNKQYVLEQKSVNLNVSYFLCWDVSKELVFPFDSFKSDQCGIGKALDSIVRSRKNSDRIDDVDILFLVYWCIRNRIGDSLESVLRIASQIDSIKDHREWLLRNAFDINIKNVVPVLKNLFRS